MSSNFINIIVDAFVNPFARARSKAHWQCTGWLKHPRGVFPAVIFLILSISVFAGNEKYSTRVAGDSILIDSALTIQDPFSPYNNPPSWTVKQSFGRVYFVYDPFATDSIPPFHSDSMVAKIRLDIKYEDKTGAIKNLNNQILKIVIYNNPDSVCQDRDVLEIPGAHKLEIKVKWLVVNGDTVPTVADTPNDIAIDAEIEVERYYAFSPDSIPSNASLIHSVDTSSNELVVSWGVLNGAEEYDLEWTYIDDYGASTLPLPDDSLNYNFRTNALRVRLSNNAYRIPMTFERGYVLYRMRGIGRGGNNFDTLIYGRWSSDNFPGGDIGSLDLFTDKIYLDSATTGTHEPFLNWEHSVIYSEGGRRSDELRYYDGLGYERQRVRKSNAASQALVKELYYDEEKRLAVEAMEAPAFDDKLKYYQAFNIDTSGNPYSHNNFDTSLTAGCGALPAAMDSSSGAAKYFSSLNPNQEGFQAFLPEAFGYTFSQRVYTPDNTGRISKQGGVGPVHQIGSGHETVFLYGQPEQVELDRLFGSEVGYAAHYRKQAVNDPNGQISVNYYDSKGNLIASGLAGAAPLNLDSLEEPEGTYKNLHSDLMQKDSANKSQATVIFDGNTLKVTKSFIVTGNGNYGFDYSMTGEQFTDSCLPSSFCFDCNYILDISLKDECGAEYVSSLLRQKKIGNTSPDTSCQNPAFSFDSTFTVFLTVGSYTLTKTLRVDDDALQQYALIYYQRNICKMDSSGFADSLRNMADTSGCNITCATCISPSDSTFPDYCEDLCGYKSRCDGFFDMMLADVSPRGQYGKYPTIINSQRSDDLSVFNLSNFLPKKPFANYLFPDPFYRDPDGDTAYVKIHNNKPEYLTTITPWQSWYIKIVQTDSANTDTFVVPQILKNLSDYIAAWKPSWALSLVKFHPEYCYYEWCHKQDSVISPCNSTSDNFDSLLLSITKYADAKAFNLIDSGSTALNPITSDPFFNCGTGAAYFNQMQGKINFMKPGIPFSSMKRVSAFAVLAPAYYSSFIPDSLSSFCTSSDTAINNAQWQFFRLLYLSAKQEIDQIIADSIALHSACDNGVNSCGCYSGCIGNDHFNEYESGMYDPFQEDGFGFHSTFDQPAWQHEQPCAWFNAWRFRNSIRRYAAPDMLVDFANAGREEDTFDNLKAWAELQQYYATGQCPIEFDLQNLLAAFAQKNDLIGIDIPMFSYPQFTQRLYDTLTHPSDTVFVPVTWTGTVVSDTTFTGTFSSDSGNCEVSLLSPDTLDWNDIRGFMKLHFKKQDSLGGYIFSVIALLNTDTNPSTIDDTILLKGRTCITLSPCVFNPVCNITPQAKDASQLWAILADTGLFTSTTPVDLSPEPLYNAITDRLLSYIGNDSSNIHWMRVSAYKTDSVILQLYGAGTDTLQFDMKTVTPSGLDFDSILAFTGLVNDTNLEMFPSDKFLISGWINGSPPSAVPLSGTATVRGIKGAQPFLIMDCEIPRPAECDGKEEEYSNFDAIKIITKFALRDTLITPDTVTDTRGAVQSLKEYFGGEILLWDSISLYAVDTTNEDTLIGYLISITDTDTFATCPIRFIFPDSMPPIYSNGDVSGLIGAVLIDTLITDGKYYDFYGFFKVKIPVYFTDSLGDTTGTGDTFVIFKVRVTTCFPIDACLQCEPSAEAMLQDLIDLKRREAGPGCTDCGTKAEATPNYVRNGSFEMGDTLFTTNLAKVVGTCPDTAQYCIPDITNTTDSCVISFAKDSFICSKNTKFLLAGEMTLAKTDTAVLWQQKVEMPGGDVFKDSTGTDSTFSDSSRANIKPPAGPLCLTFKVAAHSANDTMVQDTVKLMGRIGSQEKEVELAVVKDVSSSLWMQAVMRFELETVMEESKATDSVDVDISVMSKKAGESTTSDTGRVNIAPIGIDSIQLGQCPCAPDSFSIPPGIPYPYHDDCGENMELAAIADADYFYDAYSDSIVRNFKNVYTQKCLGALENFTMDFVSKEQHFTLYYYNQAGNLVRTVSPKGVNMIEDTLVLKQAENARTNKQSNALTQHTLNNFYRYNSLDQQTIVNTPDGGYTLVFYDRLGRQVASQNSEQRNQSPQRYSYTRFDALGRTVEAGELYSSAVPTSTILNAANFPDNWSTARTEIIKTFFDSIAIAVPDFKPRNLRTRVSSTAFYDTIPMNIGTFRYATHYDYDIHGNAKTVVQDMIPLQPVSNRYKRMDYRYDLISGKVLELNYQKGGADYFSHKYFYDSDNRLIEAHTTTDGVLWDRDAKYFYYDHGPLGRVELGRQRVQGTDYAYTLQGWVKGINSATLLPDRDMGKDGIAGNAYMSSQPDIHRWVARDEFSYMLGYFDGDYQSVKNIVGSWELGVGSAGNYAPELFNGNIRLSAINIKKFDTLMVYAYRYDQLNRLTQMRGFDNADIANNTWSAANPLEKYATNYTYDPNGNILRMKRNGATPVEMDSLQYVYYANKNQLAFIKDSVPVNFYTDDLDNQNSGNYTYGKIGNLIADASEEIQQIKWTVYGKVKKIKRNGGSKKPELNFEYDALNNRVHKTVKDSSNKETEIFYVRDAQGNILATYNYIKGSGKGGNKLYLDEQMIYGSSRIGTIKRNKLLPSLNLIINPVGPLGGLGGFGGGFGIGKPILTKPVGKRYTGLCGSRRYELDSWLGNLQVVISDKKIPIDTNSNGWTDYYQSHVVSATDFYPGGMEINNRSENSTNYKFGVQGQLKDDEVKGDGNSYSFDARILDTRSETWLSRDPYSYFYADISPYVFVARNPIYFIDPDGRKIIIPYVSQGGTVINLEYKPGVGPTGDKFADAAIEALDYLLANNAGSDVINALINDPDNEINIERVNGFNDEYVAVDKTVLWNPKSGTVVTSSNKIGRKNVIGYQSPALGLLHELGHAYIQLILKKTFNDKGAQNAPEEHEFLLKTIEKPAAKKLGEAYTEVYDLRYGEKMMGPTLNIPLSKMGDFVKAKYKDFTNRKSSGSKPSGKKPSGKSCTVRSLCCFAKGTKITMHDGSPKNIEYMEEGDYIKTIDLNTMVISDGKVLEVSKPIHRDMVSITFDNGAQNKNTFDHSYWVKNKGWSSFKPALTFKRYGIEAKQLEVGDTVIKYENDEKLVNLIVKEIKKDKGKTQTYNVFLEKPYSAYFANGVIVHDESLKDAVFLKDTIFIDEDSGKIFSKTNNHSIIIENSKIDTAFSWFGKSKIERFKNKIHRKKIAWKVSEYEKRNILITMDTENIITQVDISEPSIAETNKGIIIGTSTKNEILQKYGQPSSMDWGNKYFYTDDKGKYIEIEGKESLRENYIEYEEKGLIFLFEREIVKTIKITRKYNFKNPN